MQLAPAKASAHDVFTVFSNGGAWPTQGLSFFVGLIGNVFAMFGTMPSQFRYEMEANVNLMSGCDSAVHVHTLIPTWVSIALMVINRWLKKSTMQILLYLGRWLHPSCSMELLASQ